MGETGREKKREKRETEREKKGRQKKIYKAHPMPQVLLNG